jgi:TupA-like ATPgrasp
MRPASSVRSASRSLIYRLPAGMERRFLFAYYNRKLPHFRRPVTFSDKVNWRILNDRRPLLEWTCDKPAMKEQAGRAELEDLYIPQTIWSGSDIRDLQAKELPEHWVLKPNHRSGLIHFGHAQADQRELSVVTAEWLGASEAREMREWAYSTARPMLLVEEFLGPPGSPPPDYKFFVFHGKAELIEMVNRYSGNQQRLYRADWSPLMCCTGLRFTASGQETANRSSEFVYVGIALCFAFILESFLGSSRGRRMYALGIVVLVFVGGIAVSWNYSQRLAPDYGRANGPEMVTPDDLALARWMLTSLGPAHRIAADPQTSLALAQIIHAGGGLDRDGG